MWRIWLTFSQRNARPKAYFLVTLCKEFKIGSLNITALLLQVRDLLSDCPGYQGWGRGSWGWRNNCKFFVWPMQSDFGLLKWLRCPNTCVPSLTQMWQVQVIQIDEAALREGLPLRKSEQADYQNWAVHGFRITTCGVKDSTQVCNCLHKPCNLTTESVSLSIHGQL